MKKIVFFEMDKFEKKFVKSVMKDFSDTEIVITDEKLNLKIAEKYSDADIISVFIYSKANSEVLSKMKNLKAVLTRSTGTDHIDLEWCKRNNVIVKNVPSYGENTVAEYAFGLLLSITRRIFETVEGTKRGSFSLMKGIDLKGKTIGVIGTGRIGRHFVRIAHGFETNILAYDINKNKEIMEKYGVKYVPLEELLKKSDIVSLHLPLLPKTRHIINMKTVKLMKNTILINTSRGAIIDTDALLYGIENGNISYAGLDVLESEHRIMQLMKPEQISKLSKKELEILTKDHYILNHNKVLFTPHNAFNTIEANHRIIETTIENLREVMKDSLQ